MKARTKEGTWFAVPLRSSGYAVGVVARVSGPSILAYFFGKVWTSPPALAEVEGLRAADAIRVLLVGDLGLSRGYWPNLGRDAAWKREEWPVPPFVRKDPLSRRAWVIQYSDDNIELERSCTPTPFDSPLEPDALCGYGAAEIKLTKMLRRPVDQRRQDATATGPPYVEPLGEVANDHDAPPRESLFDTDAVRDWLAELAEGDAAAVSAALEAVTSAAPDAYIEVDEASIALAAAELVAAASGKGRDRLDEDAAAWLDGARDALRRLDVAEAHRAATRVFARSELRDLWDEQGEDTAWHASVRELIARLAG